MCSRLCKERIYKKTTLNTKFELTLFSLQSTTSLHWILKQQSKIKSPKWQGIRNPDSVTLYLWKCSTILLVCKRTIIWVKNEFYKSKNILHFGKRKSAVTFSLNIVNYTFLHKRYILFCTFPPKAMV